MFDKKLLLFCAVLLLFRACTVNLLCPHSGTRFAPRMEPGCRGQTAAAAEAESSGVSRSLASPACTLPTRTTPAPQGYQASHYCFSWCGCCFHLTLERKDGFRRLEELGDIQKQHFGYTKPFMIWFLLTLSHLFCTIYTSHSHPRLPVKYPVTLHDSVQGLPALGSLFGQHSSSPPLHTSPNPNPAGVVSVFLPPTESCADFSQSASLWWN